MNIIAPELPHDERKQAQIIWDYLFASTTWAQSVRGHQLLQEAPQSVQLAISHFVALALKQSLKPREMINPFI
ncbi:MAG: hypothetical protein EOP06_11765 [Proteobacteria bacterium]|nr:MAG: hypothetical protein EOP06_11765 [Pseudomonadota bacterium]